VNVIVILNFTPVSFVNLSEEAAEKDFIQVRVRIEMESAHNMNSQNGQSWLTTDLLHKPVDIKINRVYLCEQIVILIYVFLYCV